MNTPNIIPAAKLDVLSSQFSDAAIIVVKELQEAGYEAYLVGGCVRDVLLNRKPKDFDVSTNASPEEVCDIFRNSRVIGRRFRITHVRLKGELIEVTTFRANPHEKQNASRNELREGDEGQLTRDNVFGTLDEDAFRRDFTINALYYDPIEGVVLDYMDSVSHIKNGVLEAIGDMEQRFTEDPVRMLRAIRFSAKFDFELPKSFYDLIEEKQNLISTVSAPRMFEEVLKLFHSGQAVKTFHLLCDIGLFKLMFPFTAEYLVKGEVSLPEKALRNTDKRISEGKPVIPAFLFTCLLWDAVREDAQNLLDQGNPASKAWRVAMLDALRDQSQYVSIPRRLADVVIEIWTLHFRLVSRKPKTIHQIMDNRRFRAAYDFMLLRASMSEVDQDLADWWTHIQELDEDGKDEKIDALAAEYKADQDDDGEPNFNSVDYVEKQHKPKKNWNGKGRGGKPSGGRGKNNNRHRSKSGGQNNQNGQRRRNKNASQNRGNSSGNGAGASHNQGQRSQGANSQNSINQDSGGHNSNGNGNNSNSNGNNGNSQRKNKSPRSNPYRTRRRSSTKTKKEDSYF